MRKFSRQQLATQEQILLRINPWLTIHEAKQKDIQYWCTVIAKKWCPYDKEWNSARLPDLLFWDHNIDPDHFFVVWLAPTLSRVLKSLWHRYLYYGKTIFEKKRDEDGRYEEQVCLRKLLNDDGTDATLRDQSQHTQDVIGELLGVKLFGSRILNKPIWTETESS